MPIILPDYALTDIQQSLAPYFATRHPTLAIVECTRDEQAFIGTVTFTMDGGMGTTRHTASFSIHPDQPRGPIPYLRAVREAIDRTVLEIGKRPASASSASSDPS